jgi:hypothetical protein
MEWVPLADVPGLIDSGAIWNSGSLVGLLKLLAARTRTTTARPVSWYLRANGTLMAQPA